MKIGIIVGSHRKESQSAKVGNFLAQKLKDMAVQTWTLDLGKTPLPIWQESFWDGGPEWDSIWKPIDSELRGCEGFVTITPEYAGMASPALKNFFLYAGVAQLGHKPSLLVGVSAGRGGAFPVDELRGSSYKNSKLCHIPEQLLFRDTEHLLNPGDPVSQEDSYIRERSAYALRVLLGYAEALSEVRESGVTDDPRFKNGMS